MAMVRDAYPPAQAAKQFPKVMLVMLSAPLLAPAIGTLLLPLGWQSSFFFLAVYGIAMLLGFTKVPETVQSIAPKMQFAKILPQYFAVLSTRINKQLIPLRWIFAQGLMTSIMLVFITNASFIYLEYFSVEAHWFVAYFGMNVVAMMIATFLTTRLIHNHSPFKLYSIARAIQYSAVLGLAVLVLTTTVSLAWFAALLCIAIGCNGIISPSVQGMFLAPFSALSGSASFTHEHVDVFPGRSTRCTIGTHL